MTQDEKLLGGNILDLIIKHNKRAKDDEKLSMAEVVESCALFKLAAVDTSRIVTQFSLNHLINDAQSMDWFVANVVNKLGTSNLSRYETYESSVHLARFTREVLRKYAPFPVIMDRRATKDFTIGEYRIFKGEMVNFNTAGIHHSEQYYKNPTKLNFDRAEASAGTSNKQPFFAFSSGKRSCIGRFLGELMIQLMLIHIFKHFDLKPVKNLAYGCTLGPAYCPISCYLRLRPKTKI